MELFEKLRACFLKVVFVKGTPEAATPTYGKTVTSKPDLSYPNLSRPDDYTTTLYYTDPSRQGGAKYFVSIDLTLNRTFSLAWPVTK